MDVVVDGGAKILVEFLAEKNDSETRRVIPRRVVLYLLKAFILALIKFVYFTCARIIAYVLDPS